MRILKRREAFFEISVTEHEMGVDWREDPEENLRLAIDQSCQRVAFCAIRLSRSTLDIEDGGCDQWSKRLDYEARPKADWRYSKTTLLHQPVAAASRLEGAVDSQKLLAPQPNM